MDTLGRILETLTANILTAVTGYTAAAVRAVGAACITSRSIAGGNPTGTALARRTAPNRTKPSVGDQNAGKIIVTTTVGLADRATALSRVWTLKIALE